jgi:D-tyrosyl-tRNA(Tyr) deacylase
MRAVVQRVEEAGVVVDGVVRGRTGRGILIYLGVAAEDTVRDARWMAEKAAELRIFDDDDGVMNRSAREIGAEALVISQFTLLADARKGRRPSYSNAAKPEAAKAVYELFVDELRKLLPRVETGVFQADMKVLSTNDGPVTILLDSTKLF